MDSALPVKLKFSPAHLPLLIKRAFATLAQNDPLRMAGATAFFTSFALPFILLLLIQLLGLIVNPFTIRHALFKDLSGIIGEKSMRQVVSTLVAFRHLARNGWITAFGFVFLLLVSTTLLMVIKGSINQLWRIKPVKGRAFSESLRVRLQSVLIIVATGMVILVSLLAQAAQAYLGKNLSAIFPATAYYINSIVNHFLSLVFATLWFGILFRLLPDGRPSWKVTFTGAFVTAVLFIIGKHVLRILLLNSNIGSLYGASASIVLILLFVFYTSLILYFGAAFTAVWAEYFEQPIKALKYARRYKVQELKEEAGEQ